MSRLIKPQKQSYTGEDSKVVAYSLRCEVASVFKYCAIGYGLAALTGHPVLAGFAATCAGSYIITSFMSCFI